MSSDLLRYLTSTVGLVSSEDDGIVNVMSAEWTYFVAREPLHIAIGMQRSNHSHAAVRKTGRFSVTLCDVSLAPVAEFCGSFSGSSLPKTNSREVLLAGPSVNGVPHVRGGVLNAECLVTHTVDLPGYTLFIGEAVWHQADETALLRPLVKHGAMFELGSTITSQQIVASACFVDGHTILVGATLQGVQPPDPWCIEVVDGCGRPLVKHVAPAEGDLEERVSLPSEYSSGPVSVRVSRAGCAAGTATVRPQTSTTGVGPGPGQGRR